MSEIVTYQDRTRLGTFSQIRLDDGKRILISFTQTEIAVFKLLGGNIPIKKLFVHNIEQFLEFFSVRVKMIDFGGSLLESVVECVLPSKTMDEVIEKLNLVIDGFNRKDVCEKIRVELKQKMQELPKEN